MGMALPSSTCCFPSFILPCFFPVCQDLFLSVSIWGVQGPARDEWMSDEGGGGGGEGEVEREVSVDFKKSDDGWGLGGLVLMSRWMF